MSETTDELTEIVQTANDTDAARTVEVWGRHDEPSLKVALNDDADANDVAMLVSQMAREGWVAVDGSVAHSHIDAKLDFKRADEVGDEE